jgi:periplasmic divalent cation tolerance protein
MTMTETYQICLVAAGDKETARKISEGLIKEKFAACVSMVEGVTSAYRWQGRLETSSEILLLIKTRKSLSSDVSQFIKKNHPYTVPEILFIDIAGGSREYLDWLGANTLFTANISKDRQPRKKT